MASVNVLIQIYDDQGTPLPLDGVYVRVFDILDVFMTDGTTDIAGEVNFTLLGDTPGVDYIIRLSKDGVSFPPRNEFTINVTDPPSPPNEFLFTGHEGLLGQLVKLVCSDDTQPTPLPVEGTKIRLYDDADLFVTEVLSPANGEIEMVLAGAPDPGQKYFARVFAPIGSSVQGGQTHEVYVMDPLPVGTTNIFDFTILTEEVPVTGEPLKCRLTGHFIDGGGNPRKDVIITFRPREGYPKAIPSGFPFSGEPTVFGGKIISGEYIVRSDNNGYVDFLLPRRSVFDVAVSDLANPSTEPLASIWVPDLAGVKLEDVFFPYVTKVTYDANTIDLVVGGDSVDVGVVIEMSNRQENVTGIAALAAFLVWTVDVSVVSVRLTEEGKLRFSGVAPGTCNLVVTRNIGTFAPFSPEHDPILPLPSEPVITVI